MDKSLLLASEVIARRLPLLAGEAAMLPGTLNASHRRESERMVSEKLAALGEGMVEAGFSLAMMQFNFMLMGMRGDAFGMLSLTHKAPRKMARAFASPGRRRLSENIRRLRKSR